MGDDLDVVTADLSRQLGGWAAANVTLGLVVAALAHRGGSTQLRSFGTQTALWGAIDGAIALAGSRRPPPTRQRLRSVLLVNAALDVGYVGVGVLAAARGGRWRDGRWASTARGHGVAVVVQGAYLLWLDTHHARRLR